MKKSFKKSFINYNKKLLQCENRGMGPLNIRGLLQ